MNSAIELLHSLFSVLVGFVLWPLGWAGEGPSLAFASVVFGLILLLAYGRVSNQKAIADIKASIGNSLLEVILFRHQPLLCLKAQGLMFRGGLRYFLAAVPPILILAIPSIFLLAQLNMRFGHAAARTGQPLVVQVKAADSKSLDKLNLRMDPRVSVAGPVRVPDQVEAFFRLTPQEGGQYRAAIEGFGDELALTVPVERTVPVIESGRFARWWMSVLYPAEETLPAEIEEVRVLYPSKNVSILGIETNWLIHFFLISFFSALLASKFLGIQI